MPNFSLTGVLRFDTAGIDAGVAHGIAQAKNFATQAAAIAQRLRADLDAGKDESAIARAAKESEKFIQRNAGVDRDMTDKMVAAQRQASAAALKIKRLERQQNTLDDESYGVRFRELKERELEAVRRIAGLKIQAEGRAQAQRLQIEEDAAAKSRPIQAGGVAGGGGEGGLGEKRAFRGAARFAVGQAMAQGGEVPGLLSHAMFAGNMATGAALVGVAALVGIYEAAGKQAEELAKIQKEHAAAAKESTEWLEKMVGQYAKAQPGAEFAKRLAEEAKKADQIREDLAKKAQDAGRFEKDFLGKVWTGLQMTVLRRPGGTDAEKAIKEEFAALEDATKRANELNRARQEESIIIRRIRAENAGASKERLEFLEEYAKRAHEIEVAGRDKNVDKNALAAAKADLAEWKAEKQQGFAKSSGDEATMLANRMATARAELEHDKNAREWLAHQQRVAKDESDPERQRLRKAAEWGPFAKTEQQMAEAEDARAKLKTIDEARGLDEKVIAQKFAKEKYHIQMSAYEASVMVQKAGYARDLLLLKAHHMQEIADDEHTGEERQAILARQKSEEQALRARADEQIADQLRTVQDQTAIALGQKTAQQVQWDGMQRQLEQLGATKQKVDELKAAWEALNKVKADEGILKQMKELDITIALATGKMTKAEADMARMQLANPNVAPALLKDLQAKQQQAEQAEFTKGEKDKLKTKLDAYKEYRAKLDEAVKGGNMTQAQENALLQKKMGELLPHDEHGGRGSRGNQGVGRWEDAASRYQSITSALLKGDGDDALLKATKEEGADIKGLREENRRLTNIINGGITLKTPMG